MYSKKWSKKYSSPRVLEKVLQMLKSALANVRWKTSSRRNTMDNMTTEPMYELESVNSLHVAIA